jgi:hypothetical protein
VAESTSDLAGLLAAMPLSGGRSVLEASRTRPVMLIFLRHMGCTFCREAMADLGRVRSALEALVLPVLVHMSTPSSAAAAFAKHGLSGIEHISDPSREFYRGIGLARGGLLQLFGPSVWLRGFQAGIIDRHLVGALEGDGFQMPGVFIISDGRIVNSLRHGNAGERPDYLALASQGALTTARAIA